MTSYQQGALPLLFVSDRANNMPPMWDGQEVTWETNGVAPDLTHLPHPQCNACGSTQPRGTAIGTTYPLPGTTFERTARPTKRLYLSRCPDCLHDQVYDTTKHELWDLDSSDYSTTGSIDPRGLPA